MGERMTTPAVDAEFLDARARKKKQCGAKHPVRPFQACQDDVGHAPEVKVTHTWHSGSKLHSWSERVALPTDAEIEALATAEYQRDGHWTGGGLVGEDVGFHLARAYALGMRAGRDALHKPSSFLAETQPEVTK